MSNTDLTRRIRDAEDLRAAEAIATEKFAIYFPWFDAYWLGDGKGRGSDSRAAHRFDSLADATAEIRRRGWINTTQALGSSAYVVSVRA